MESLQRLKKHIEDAEAEIKTRMAGNKISDWPEYRFQAGRFNMAESLKGAVVAEMKRLDEDDE